MLEATLTFGTLFSIMFFLVGGILGWLMRQNSCERSYTNFIHPEMFDANGNIIPDEILALRFETDYDTDNDDEEDDED